ncbi:MAG TPA: hypothetical protein VNJ52_06170, partial [Patescibacteria group bacterium]|nr:hypothetical protein [Patescibacteria group bacterium]
MSAGNTLLRFALAVLFFGSLFSAAAQDTAFEPRGQQIPPPECMNLHFAWEGAVPGCGPFTHGRWLHDLEHW